MFAMRQNMNTSLNADIQMYEKTIMPCCYLPPISFWSIFFNSQEVEIEYCENFVKSTFRNRCEIAGANGVLKLSIPIEGGKSHRQLFKDTRIANEIHWQKHHWQSLCSAYRRSAYFEYYEEKFIPFYERKFRFLFDFNVALMEMIVNLLQVNKLLRFTKNFQKCYDVSVLDLRNRFKSCNEDFSVGSKLFTPPRYFQCFEMRNGFLPNLSIVDILFSEGQQAFLSIKNSLSEA
jgi:hypothetical protein